MELKRTFNLEIEASTVIEAMNKYIDDVVRKATNNALKFEDLTPQEVTDIYAQISSFISQESIRVTSV